MNGAFDTTDYVVEYDGSGNVWVEPPGQYDTSYNAAHGSPQACAGGGEVTGARSNRPGCPGHAWLVADPTLLVRPDCRANQMSGICRGNRNHVTTLAVVS